MTTKKNDHEEILHFLVSNGIALDSSNIDVVPLPSRSHAKKVLVNQQPTFLIKPQQTPRNPVSVWLEESANWLAPASQAEVTPQRMTEDAKWRCYSWIDNAVPFLQIPTNELTEELASSLAKKLRQLHALPTCALENLDQQKAPHDRVTTPAILSIHEYAQYPGLDRKLILQIEGRCQKSIDTLLNTLNANTLVHGDLNANNILVQSTSATCHLIDWDHAGVGDTAWDIGYLIAACMRHWMLNHKTTSYNIDELLSADDITWHPYALWLKKFLECYGSNREASLKVKATAVAGLMLLNRGKNQNAHYGRLSAKDTVLLFVAEKLLLDPEGAYSVLLPHTGTKHA